MSWPECVFGVIAIALAVLFLLGMSGQLTDIIAAWRRK